jgi:hypothetical protein
VKDPSTTSSIHYKRRLSLLKSCKNLEPPNKQITPLSHHLKRKHVSTSLNSAFSSFNTAPTQAEFIKHGLSDGSVPSGARYSICVEDCSSGEEKPVKLICLPNCYFHGTCIMAWFNSSHERRGTCPNDRTVLFIPLRFNHQQHSARAQAQVTAISNDPEYIAAIVQARTGIARLEFEQDTATNPNTIVSQWHQVLANNLIMQIQDSLVTMRQPRPGVSVATASHITDALEESEDAFYRVCVAYSDAARTVLLAYTSSLVTRLDAISPESICEWWDQIAANVRALPAAAENAEWQAMPGHLNELRRLAGELGGLET